MANKNDSPIGRSVEEHIGQRRARSDRYRETQDRLRPFEEIARVVIMRRAQLELTQQELAVRMGTTKSVISRIESGQHPCQHRHAAPPRRSPRRPRRYRLRIRLG